MQEFGYNPDPRGNEIFLAENTEKRKLSRAAIAVTVPCFVFFLVTEFFRDIALFIGARLGYNEEKTLTFLSDPVNLQTVQIALSLTLLIVPFAICVKIYGFNISSGAALNRPQKGTRVPFYLFGVGFCAFANVAVAAAGRIFERFGLKDSSVGETKIDGIWGLLISLLATAIVPAIVEEFAFRGIVQGILLPFGEGLSVIGSAAVFGILHGNFEQIPFAFLVGLVLGFVRTKSGSLAICTAIHATNNAVAVLALYSGVLPTAIANVIYSVYILLALTLAILGVALVKKKDSFSLSAYEGVLPAKKRYVGFFFSFPFLAFFLVFLFRAVSKLF
ncbi:MAG: CPBP family intramembrane metalloprotease [Clostridia bacterium]|nr:CPBP family intramembrane metalloprotease [Clostridia bacterium]